MIRWFEYLTEILLLRNLKLGISSGDNWRAQWTILARMLLSRLSIPLEYSPVFRDAKESLPDSKDRQVPKATHFVSACRPNVVVRTRQTAIAVPLLSESST
jgi:hypothetical protein